MVTTYQRGGMRDSMSCLRSINTHYIEIIARVVHLLKNAPRRHLNLPAIISARRASGAIYTQRGEAA